MQNEVVPKKYIEIDSTYRNRNLYPNAGEFKIPVLNRGQKDDIIKAFDGVTNGTSPFFWKGRNDVDFTVGGVPSAVEITNIIGTEEFFRGQFVRLSNGEESLVIGYSSYNSILYMEEPFNEFIVGSSAIVVNPSNNSKIVVFTNETTFNQQFVDSYLLNMNSGEYRKIVKYNFDFKTIDLEKPLTLFNSDDTFGIVKQIPYYFPTSPLDSSVNFGKDSIGTYVELVGASTIDDEYKDKYLNLIYFEVFTPVNVSFYIKSYDGTTQRAYVHPSELPIFNVSTEIYYTVSDFTKDIHSGLNSYLDLNLAPRFYKISLNNLVLPNTIISNSNGGQTRNYPYVYVSIYNSSNKTLSIIDSNNPFTSGITFRCPITDLNDSVSASFIKLNTDMVVKYRVNPREDLIFKVSFPDGSVFKTLISDTLPPIKPDPLLQISAAITFEEIKENLK